MFAIVRTHQPIFTHSRISFFVRVLSFPRISLNSFDTCFEKCAYHVLLHFEILYKGRKKKRSVHFSNRSKNKNITALWLLHLTYTKQRLLRFSNAKTKRHCKIIDSEKRRIVMRKLNVFVLWISVAFFPLSPFSLSPDTFNTIETQFQLYVYTS